MAAMLTGANARIITEISLITGGNADATKALDKVLGMIKVHCLAGKSSALIRYEDCGGYKDQVVLCLRAALYRVVDGRQSNKFMVAW